MVWTWKLFLLLQVLS